MLHAILHGKAGRIEREGESLRWLDLFKGSEDLLTATFFGRLPHLSDGALKAVLRFLLGDNPLDPGHLSTAGAVAKAGIAAGAPLCRARCAAPL
ncbi:hypothetical protein ACKC5O_12120 [Aeromonas schubertii]|uniref:hypothetical protein n=1 Tax=Aeromonas schubertii TaxID=652 RepID=UPI0038B5FF04